MEGKNVQNVQKEDRQGGKAGRFSWETNDTRSGQGYFIMKDGEEMSPGMVIELLESTVEEPVERDDMYRDGFGRIWVPNGHPTSTGWVMLDDVDWQEVGGVIYVR
jgi:hypothetical protein